MRPVSIENLLGDGSDQLKPKFLTKKQRKRLSEEKEAKEAEEKALKQKGPKPNARAKFGHEDTIVGSDVDYYGMRPANPKKARFDSKKFNFGWNADDDTSTDYNPLVAYETDLHDKHRGISDSHWSEKPLKDMTLRDWRIFREDYNISMKGGPQATAGLVETHPLRSWSESSIHKQVLDLLQKFGFVQPTPIQRATIPIATMARDLVGIAETGSGKTLSFLVPLLDYLLRININYMHVEHTQEGNLHKPLGLILAPTRELALQISSEASKFGSILGFTVVTIIGGHQYEETIHSLRNGVHIVVATPGRLVDSVERGMINLLQCHYLIMDEADKMIDMGFEKSLLQILSFLPATDEVDVSIFNIKHRVTLMFTATMSPAIEKLTKNYLNTPTYLFIGNIGEAVDNIDQRFEYLKEITLNETDNLDPTKTKLLLSTLQSHIRTMPKTFSIIIFANYKKICEELAATLESNGFSNQTVVVHGSKTQEFRERAITSFRNHSTRILIATDVAARGIDVPNVSLVVNYQMARKFDEYIHRIGRTGRAGNQGASYTIFDESNSDIFPELKKFLARGRKRCPDWLLRHESTMSNTLKE